MTIKELEKTLEEIGAQDPRAEAEIIINHLFGISVAQMYLDRGRDYSSPELDSLLEKRKARIPLQYILGEWSFMGNSFYVSEACLIPRPDTELLVERAVREAKSGDRVADLCTGSGCIGLSLLMHRPDIESVTLMDISPLALEMARRNSRRHGLESRCAFVLGDVRSDIPKERFDMILSNPPYIPTQDIEGLSQEVKKEPRLALDGGEDGLDIIRFLVSEGISYLRDGGKMLIEFGYDQKEQIESLLDEKADTGLIKSYEIVCDYGSNPRLLVINT